MASDKKTAVAKWWIITNVVTAVLLLWLAWREHYPTRIYKRLTGTNDTTITISYDSYWHAEQVDLQSHYGTKANIVMLGSSLTFRAQWHELLGRCDVVNRGIPSDLTSGYLERLPVVLAAHPKVCFIEGGINDVAQGVSEDSIVAHLHDLCRNMRAAAVVPVLVTIPFRSSKAKEYVEANQRIDVVNQKLRQLAARDSLTYIDLNKSLSDGRKTADEYTTADGIHFNSAAYDNWQMAIAALLHSMGI